MPAGLKLLDIDLPLLGHTEAWRYFDGPELYKMYCAASVDWWLPSTRDLSMLRVCIRAIRQCFYVAGQRGETVKTGALFIRKFDDDHIVELGILDNEAIYFKFLTMPQIRLANEDGEALLVQLEKLAADASRIGVYTCEPSRLAASGPSRADDMLLNLHRRLDKKLGWK